MILKHQPGYRFSPFKQRNLVLYNRKYKAKNSYEWRGLESIGQFVKSLEFSKFPSITPITTQEENSISPTTEISSKSKINTLCGTNKRKKSLGQLCIKFINLFTKRSPILSLEQAAEILSLSYDYHKIKTKIRRLYDIDNVLQALHIIEKVLLLNRKPGFKWLGYQGFIKHFGPIHSEAFSKIGRAHV